MSISTDINTQDSEGRTLLMNACLNCDLQTVQSLLARGAGLNLQDNDGETALMKAAEGRPVGLGRFVGSERWTVSPNLDNRFKEEAGIVRTLLAAGADEKIVDNKKDETAFIKALRRGNVYAALLLFSDEEKAKGQWKEVGEEALRQAVEQKFSKEVVSKLVDMGINPIVTYDNGQTLLGRAVQHGNLGHVQELCRKVSVNIQDGRGKTALMDAAARNDGKMVKKLFELGADQCIQDERGETALMKAIRAMIKNRRAYQAYSQFVDRWNQDAVDVVANDGESAYSLSISAGCNLYHDDGVWYTYSPCREKALSGAIEKGNLVVVKRILNHIYGLDSRQRRLNKGTPLCFFGLDGLVAGALKKSRQMKKNEISSWLEKFQKRDDGCGGEGQKRKGRSRCSLPSEHHHRPASDRREFSPLPSP